MKKLFVIFAVLTLTGCAYMQATFDILDIFLDPAPVCNKENVGTYQKGGDLCVKYADGTYGWQRVAK